jgi:hypothetical protein
VTSPMSPLAPKAPVDLRMTFPTKTEHYQVKLLASSHRYFPATILGGRLHIRALPAFGQWNPARLERADEEFVDMFVDTDPIHRKAGTREELEAVMKEPRGVSPTLEVWMHESLVDEARRL